MKNDEEQFLNGIFCITMSGENRHRHACAHVYFLERNKETKNSRGGQKQGRRHKDKRMYCFILSILEL